MAVCASTAAQRQEIDMAIRDDRPPADPRKRYEWDLAQKQVQQIEADRIAAEARLQEELKQKQAIAASDAKKLAEQQKAKAKEENAFLTEQQRARQAYLATPLTEQEQAKLVQMEAMASQQGVGNPDPDMMRDLSDYRIRAKVKVEKKVD
jgi:hypothetical protein